MSFGFSAWRVAHFVNQVARTVIQIGVHFSRVDIKDPFFFIRVIEKLSLMPLAAHLNPFRNQAGCPRIHS